MATLTEGKAGVVAVITFTLNAAIGDVLVVWGGVSATAHPLTASITGGTGAASGGFASLDQFDGAANSGTFLAATMTTAGTPVATLNDTLGGTINCGGWIVKGVQATAQITSPNTGNSAANPLTASGSPSAGTNIFAAWFNANTNNFTSFVLSGTTDFSTAAGTLNIDGGSLLNQAAGTYAFGANANPGDAQATLMTLYLASSVIPVPTQRSSLRRVEDIIGEAEDEGRFNELDVKHWFREGLFA